MAGCAMIGQSVINVKSGGRGRLSTLAAGVFLLLMVVFMGAWVARIPMAALVAVMIMVSIGTFNWTSIRNLSKHPKSSSVVMIATVIVVVATHDLAKGVLVGVLLSGFFFAHKIGQILHISSKTEDEGRMRTYKVTGQVFFPSAERFVNAFDYKSDSCTDPRQRRKHHRQDDTRPVFRSPDHGGLFTFSRANFTFRQQDR